MIQLIRMVVSLLCGFPLPIRILLALLLPIIPGVINPLNHIIFWILIFVPIYFSNSGLSKNDKNERTFGMSFRNSFFIYYALFVTIYLIAVFSVCTVSDVAGSYGI